jgi:hypothetical protein
LTPAFHRHGSAMPPLALTWSQGAGGIVTSLADMNAWDRALYQGRLLPPRQQHQLESLVSDATGKPIRHTTLANPLGLGARRLTGDQPPGRHALGVRGRVLRRPGRAPLLPPLRHHHRGRRQQRDRHRQRGRPHHRPSRNGVPDPEDRRCRSRNLNGAPNSAGYWSRPHSPAPIRGIRMIS